MFHGGTWFQLCQDCVVRTDDERSPRRQDALSAHVIVAEAVAVLDDSGIGGLTFRALSKRLRTGPGAIYHHVANKEELLAAAALKLANDLASAHPDNVREFMLAIHDLIEGHRWLGAQLSSAPWQDAVMMLFESIGDRLARQGLEAVRLFDVASALVNYLLGSAGQYAAGARVPGDIGRDEFLVEVTTSWTSRTDPEQFPFIHSIAEQLAHHDDRRQFAAGVDLILSGASAPN